MNTRKLSLLFLFLILGYFSEAQDIIYKLNGEEISAIVVDVSPGVVKYKKFEKPGGHVFSIAREQVEKIVYEDGKMQLFEQQDEEEVPLGEREVPKPVRASPTIGWHIGLGASSVYGDFDDSKMRMASAIGASFGLPLGKVITLNLELDILSVGYAFKDDMELIDGYTKIVVTNPQLDLGYLGLSLLGRFFLNKNRNYFIEPGIYGSFLIDATFTGERTVYDTLTGATIEPSADYAENWVYYYEPFDWGFTAGLGGRIPLGKSKKWHITAVARFYYGVQNIFDYASFNFEETRESNIFGLILLGVDLPTKSKDP